MRNGIALGVVAAAMIAAAPASAAAVRDCSTGPIWNGAAAGFINNAPYTVDGVAHAPVSSYPQGRNRYDQYHFYLSSKAGQMFELILITMNGVKPDGTTMTMGLHGNGGSEAAPGARNVQFWSMEDKTKKLKIMNFSVSDATMQVVFGKRSGMNLPVQIHFCIPSKRTEVAGHFHREHERDDELDNRLVDESAALAVLDLDDPDVGVDPDLLVEIGARLFLIGGIAQGLNPDEIALCAAARLVEHQRRTVEARDLKEDRAGIFRTLAGDVGLCARNFDPADQCAHENAGLEAGNGHAR